jgi:hypothetical protein
MAEDIEDSEPTAAPTPAAPSTPVPAAAPNEPEPYDPGEPRPELTITFERGLQVPQVPLADIEKKQGEGR